VRRRPDIELIVLARGGSREAAEALFDRSLMPWVTLLAVVPLAYVLRRRNF
jgi:hypothetical protein